VRIPQRTPRPLGANHGPETLHTTTDRSTTHALTRKSLYDELRASLSRTREMDPREEEGRRKRRKEERRKKESKRRKRRKKERRKNEEERKGC